MLESDILKINEPYNEIKREHRTQICAKVPYSLKKDIEKYARADDRTVSNLTSILIKLGFREYLKNIPEELLI